MRLADKIEWTPNTENKKIEDFNTGTLVRLKNRETLLLGDHEAGSRWDSGCGCCAEEVDSPVTEFCVIFWE